MADYEPPKKPYLFELRARPHDVEPCPYPMVEPGNVFPNWPLPQTEEEWAAQENLVKVDANDLVFELGPEGFRKWLDESPTYVSTWNTSEIVSLGRLMDTYPQMRPAVIHGLLRRGETMNIIAPPKSNKSWLSFNIAMNIIGGGKLFDQFQCERGKVLIIDNELHCETIAQRGRDVAPALNVPTDRARNLIDFIPLRGRLTDLQELAQKMDGVLRRQYSVIILDAFYKFYPEDFDENSNSDMARLYTLLDAYAEHFDCGLILIHHSSKGGQANKGVTDMGAGAGSQSRACDAHLVLRKHEDPGVFVIDCANRSFPPIAPFCAKFKWPKWEAAPNADPEMLEGLTKKGIGGMRVGGDKSVGKDGKALSPKKSWKEDEKSRIDTFIAAEVLTPMTEVDILKIGNGRQFRPWNHDRMKILKPLLIGEGKLRVVKEGAGRTPTTYISALVSPEKVSAPATTIPNIAAQNDGYTAGYNDAPSEDECYPECDE